MSFISDHTTSLSLKDGIWYSGEHSELSYPIEGNNFCFQVEDQSFWFRHRNRCIQSLVKKYSSGKVFFDIGGGNGFVSKGLQDEGIETVLVEPGIEGARNAKIRGVHHVICSTFEKASIKEISAAGMFDVIEHMENDIAFLKQIASSMNDDGMIYITVPAYQTLWSTDDTEGGHYRRYTLNHLKKTIEKAGFTEVYSTYLFTFLPLPIFFFRTLPSMLGGNRNVINKDKIKGDHISSTSVINRLVDKILFFEEKQINKGKNIPFGSSCLMVARKA